MIISRRRYPFGTVITTLHTTAFNCVVSTAKEGVIKGLSTMIIEGSNTRACGKVIYSSAMRKEDIHRAHDVLTETIDRAGNDGYSLHEALDVVFKFLKENGLASETINLA